MYRVLELFVKKGVVIKTNVMNNEMAVYELNRFKHKHYAVRMNCHKIIAQWRDLFTIVNQYTSNKNTV
ncbi:MAG: transcriptional repressor [Ruminiclostridium sp.]